MLEMRFFVVLVTMLATFASPVFAEKIPAWEQRGKIEICMSISPSARAMWRDMTRNEELGRILKNATYYVVVPGGFSSHEGAKRQVQMNMMFYLLGLAGKNAQFEFIDDVIFPRGANPDKEVMDARLESFFERYRALFNETQNRLGMKRIADNFQFYSERMVNLLRQAYGPVVKDGVDPGEFAFFVNGKYSPDFTIKFLSE